MPRFSFLPVSIAPRMLPPIVALTMAAVGLPSQEWQHSLMPRAHGIAYDSQRGRTVLYDGAFSIYGTTTAETWEYDGAHWSQRRPLHTAGTTVGELFFDPARGRTTAVSAGGGVAEYDGTDWVTLAPSPTAPSFSGSALVYDPARACAVLFGGSTNVGTVGEVLRNQTWEFTATVWTQRNPAVAPSPRHGHALAHDAARGRTVLFGGFTITGQWPTTQQVFLDETWEYDGTTWVQRTPVHAPSPRLWSAATFDPVRNRVLLFGGMHQTVGGHGYPATVFHQDTWEYDGVDWQQVATATAPPGRAVATMVFDSQRGRAVLHGGSTGVLVADTWEYDGVNWTATDPALAPGWRSATSMVYDAGRARTVLFGGRQGTDLDDTWEHDGQGWAPQPQVVRPARRSYAVAAYDQARQQTVLFGGLGPSQLFGDTWVFNGSWTNAAPPNAPSARNAAAMAYDLGRRRVVLFGGATPAPRNDTWEYDGADWTQVLTANAPGPRYFHSMAYHAALGRMVLFGGWTQPNTVLGDTWHYDGVDWTQQPVAGPPPRMMCATAYDTVRGRVQMYGGRDAANVDLADLWEYDAAGWRALAVAAPFGTPLARALASMSYDLGRTRSVLIGGITLDTTWDLVPANVPTWTRHGLGCAGAAAAPALDGAPGSQPALGSTFVLQLSALPGPAFLLFGFDLVQWSGVPLPIDLDPARPQCNLWLAPLPGASVFLPTLAGAASHPLAIPANPVFLGTVLGAQALALDASVPAGFALTNGVVLRVQ